MSYICYVYFVRNFDWAAAVRNDFCHVEEVNLQLASKFVQVASGRERVRVKGAETETAQSRKPKSSVFISVVNRNSLKILISAAMVS